MAETPFSDSETVIRTQLEPGETLLWAGRPRLGFGMRRAAVVRLSVLLIFLSCFMVGIFGTGEAPLGTMYLILALFWIPLAIAISIVNLAIDTRLRRRTAYGVTSRRVLIVTVSASDWQQSIYLDALSEITLLSFGSRGAGVIAFGPDWRRPTSDVNSLFRVFARPAMTSFELDRDARLVYQLIRDVRRTLPHREQLTA